MNTMRDSKNRFVDEMKSAGLDNPNVDMDLMREWQAIQKVLDTIPPEGMETQPDEIKKPSLQPIPLWIFSK